jgi:hypothetical protein
LREIGGRDSHWSTEKMFRTHFAIFVHPLFWIFDVETKRSGNFKLPIFSKQIKMMTNKKRWKEFKKKTRKRKVKRDQSSYKFQSRLSPPWSRWRNLIYLYTHTIHGCLCYPPVASHYIPPRSFYLSCCPTHTPTAWRRSFETRTTTTTTTTPRALLMELLSVYSWAQIISASKKITNKKRFYTGGVEEGVCLGGLCNI